MSVAQPIHSYTPLIQAPPALCTPVLPGSAKFRNPIVELVPPQKLTDGLPDLTAIEKQKAAYSKQIEVDLHHQKAVLDKQFRQFAAWHKENAEMLKQRKIYEIEEREKKERIKTSRRYNDDLMQLYRAAQQKRTELELVAGCHLLEWNAKKSQEQYMEEQYKLKQKEYHAQKNLIRELQGESKASMYSDHVHKLAIKAALGSCLSPPGLPGSPANSNSNMVAQNPLPPSPAVSYLTPIQSQPIPSPSVSYAPPVQSQSLPPPPVSLSAGVQSPLLPSPSITYVVPVQSQRLPSQSLSVSYEAPVQSPPLPSQSVLYPSSPRPTFQSPPVASRSPLFDFTVQSHRLASQTASTTRYASTGSKRLVSDTSSKPTPTTVLSSSGSRSSLKLAHVSVVSSSDLKSSQPPEVLTIAASIDAREQSVEAPAFIAPVKQEQIVEAPPAIHSPVRSDVTLALSAIPGQQGALRPTKLAAPR